MVSKRLHRDRYREMRVSKLLKMMCVWGGVERQMSRNRHQTQGDIMKTCDEGRHFKVGEVDFAERSRTMMTKNKPFNVALWGHGLPLNSAGLMSEQAGWEGTKEEYKKGRGGGSVSEHR